MKQRFLLFLLLLGQFGSAQIVNIENKRLSAKKPGFSGSIDLNLSFTRNTKSLLQFGTKLQVAYLKKRHYTLILGDHGLVKSDVESFVNYGFEHLRYNYTLKDSGRFIYEAYQQVQFNKIQHINIRLLVGNGLRFMVIDEHNYQLNLGMGFMAEYEELTNTNPTRDILSANYLSFDGQFNDHFGLNFITYFQPKFIDFGEYRLANETALRLRINKFLTFKVIYNLTHDSRHIEGIRQTNYTIKNTLSFNF